MKARVAGRFILLLLVVAVMGAGTAEAAEGLVAKKLIYQNYSPTDYSMIAVKSTNKKHVYYWYIMGERCIAMANPKTISVSCDGRRPKVFEQQGTDVVYTYDGELQVVVDGSLYHAMYWAIINHDGKTK